MTVAEAPPEQGPWGAQGSGRMPRAGPRRQHTPWAQMPAPVAPGQRSCLPASWSASGVGSGPHPWRGVGSRATGERRSSGRALSCGGRPSLVTPVFTFLAKKSQRNHNSWALKNTGEFVMPDCQACPHAVAKQTALLSQETV